MQSHFHVLITAKWGTSLMTRRFSKIISFTRAVIIYVLDGCWTDRCDHSHGSSTILKLCTPYSDTMMSLYGTTKHLYQTTANFDGGNMSGPHTPIHTTNFFEAPTFHCRCHCTSTYPLNSISPCRYVLHVSPTITLPLT